jgi:hypothetical protein
MSDTIFITKTRHFATWLEWNEKAKRAIGILQLFAAASATLYKIDPERENIYTVVFLISMAIILGSSLIVIMFYGRSGMNVLHFEKSTGLLYDEKTRIPNVALRRETMQRIFKFCEDRSNKTDVQELGFAIGKNFVESYREKNLLNDSTMNEEGVLRTVFEYDSSSGMGKFELVRFISRNKKREIEIAVWNPFIRSENGTLSPFLQGYLLGVCSEILGGQYIVATGSKRIDGNNQIYDLSVKES